MSTQAQTPRTYTEYLVLLFLGNINCMYSIRDPSGEPLLLSPLKAQINFNHTWVGYFIISNWALFHLFYTHFYCCKVNGSVAFSFISALLWTTHLQMDSLASGLHLQQDFPITSKIISCNVNKWFLLFYFILSGQISVVWWLWEECYCLSLVPRLICAYFFWKMDSYFAKIESILCFLEMWEYSRGKDCWDPLFYLPWRKLILTQLIQFQKLNCII